jgi:simple sugar transport system substrate-binding protein
MDAAIAHQKANYPNMILEPEGKIECEDNMELAYEKTKEMIKKYPNIKGFLGASSYDPPGAGKAIDELGKNGQIYAVGTSVPSVAAPYLISGSNPSVLCWDPALSGKAMLKLAVMILDGKGDEIKAGYDLGIEGYESLNTDGNMLSGNGWLVITKDNMDQYQF